jgi:hypothetical protein
MDQFIEGLARLTGRVAWIQGMLIDRQDLA